MAAAFVQATQGGNNATGTTLATAAFGSSTTTGNAIIVAVSFDNSSASTATVTDSKGNTYTAVTTKFVDANNQAIQMFYCLSITGGASHTVTLNTPGSETFRNIVAHEVSGIATSGALDKHIEDQSTSATPATGSVTTTTAGQFIFAAVVNDDAANTHVFTASGSYTEPANGTSNAANGEMQTQYQVQVSAGSITGDWTRTASGHNAHALATFIAAASSSADTAFQTGAFQSDAFQIGGYTVAGGAKTLSAAAGSYTVTGQTAGLLRSRLFAAGAGSYAITGQTANLKKGRVLTAAAGSYSLTGQAATLLRTRLFSASTGSYAVTGATASLLHGWKVTAAAGTYTVNGTDVTLTKSGGNKVLAAGAGAYTVTGQAAALVHGYVLTAGSGSYVVTGADADRAWGMAVNAGSYSVTGSSAALVVSRVLSAGTGSYSVTGSAITLVKTGNTVLSAEAGSYAISGNDATLSKTTLSAGDRGDFPANPRPRRQRRFELIGNRLYEIFATAPIPAVASKKAKKKLAKQIIVAAGDSDIIPYLAGFGDELQQIGTAALEAAQAHSITQAQAHYARIMAIIDQIEAQIAEDEADEDEAIEYLLLAA